MVFILNPYNNALDLSTWDGLKLYENIKVSLEKDDCFNGSKDKYSKFVKLIEKISKLYRMM